MSDQQPDATGIQGRSADPGEVGERAASSENLRWARPVDAQAGAEQAAAAAGPGPDARAEQAAGPAGPGPDARAEQAAAPAGPGRDAGAEQAAWAPLAGPPTQAAWAPPAGPTTHAAPPASPPGPPTSQLPPTTPPPGEPASYAAIPPPRSRRGRRLGAGVVALSLTAVLAGVAGGAIVAATDDNSTSSGAPVASTSPAPVASTGGDISKAVSTIEPSVVNITAEISGGSGQFGGGFRGQGGGTSAGTGIIVTSEGQVVTNAHVVAGATAITVQVSGHPNKVSATVIGSDSNADLALLQLKDVSGLTAATFAASNTVNVGDSVLAVGNAEGYGGSPTVTLGIVSATNRSLSGSSSDSGSSLTGLIQTDAAINPGNSGGPLVDTAGRVVGINTEVATGSDTSRAAQNIGFAIPSDKVLAELPKLRAGGGSSSTDSGGAYLGVSVEDGTSGAVIAQVVPGGAAANAGLQAGDVVTAVGSTQVGSADDLQAAIAGHKAGDKVTITVTRDGQQHTVTVELGSRSAATTQ